MYGVYMPTAQEYLNLFSNYISQCDLSKREHIVDLGCGSGILSLVAKENGKFKGTYTMIDSNETALECSKLNMELFGIFERINFRNVDISDLWFPITGTPDALYRSKQVNFYEKIAKDLEIRGEDKPEVDLIVCNPPWLPATTLSELSTLENAVYDPKEKFLISCLNFAKYHLS